MDESIKVRYVRRRTSRRTAIDLNASNPWLGFAILKVIP